jgi:hypothetical protein
LPVITNCCIADNYISNAATDADSGINLAATATGVVYNNRVAIALAGDATTGISAVACGQAQNLRRGHRRPPGRPRSGCDVIVWHIIEGVPSQRFRHAPRGRRRNAPLRSPSLAGLFEP